MLKRNFAAGQVRKKNSILSYRAELLNGWHSFGGGGWGGIGDRPRKSTRPVAKIFIVRSLLSAVIYRLRRSFCKKKLLGLCPRESAIFTMLNEAKKKNEVSIALTTLAGRGGGWKRELSASSSRVRSACRQKSCADFCVSDQKARLTNAVQLNGDQKANSISGRGPKSIRNKVCNLIILPPPPPHLIVCEW